VYVYGISPIGNLAYSTVIGYPQLLSGRTTGFDGNFGHHFAVSSDASRIVVAGGSSLCYFSFSNSLCLEFNPVLFFSKGIVSRRCLFTTRLLRSTKWR
jgi:hypothetical protein